jgi:hypothetical protein
LIVNNDSCLLNKTILRFVKYRQATLNVKGSHQRIGITAWDSPQKSHSSPMPRCGEAHAMTVPFTLHKPRSPTTKPILRVLMQTDHRRGAASPSNQSRTRQQSNVPSKRERALKVVSVKLDVPVIQQETWQSHSPPWQCFFFFPQKSGPVVRCALIYSCSLCHHLLRLPSASSASAKKRLDMVIAFDELSSAFSRDFLRALHRPRAESHTSVGAQTRCSTLRWCSDIRSMRPKRPPRACFWR